jgi:hypothetical protein
MRTHQHTAFNVLDRYDIFYAGHKSDASVGSGHWYRFLDWYGFRFSTVFWNVHLPSYPMGNRGYFPECKAAGTWSWSWPLTDNSLCFNWERRHERVLGIGGMAPRILGLGTRWRWVISFTPRPLHPQGKCPWYPLDRRLGGPQSRSGRGVKGRNSQPPAGTRTPPHQARSPALYQWTIPAPYL